MGEAPVALVKLASVLKVCACDNTAAALTRSTALTIG
jgi:hypothetical protein